MSAPQIVRRNLTRRELRTREEARRIVIRSDVPLTRAEREKREVAAYWQMRFDERTRAAQIVVERWRKIRALYEKASSKLAFLMESVALLRRFGSSSLVPIAAAEAEAAVEEAESFVLHQGADRWLGDATWAPRVALRRLQAQIDW